MKVWMYSPSGYNLVPSILACERLPERLTICPWDIEASIAAKRGNTMRRMWIILIISELCYVPWYSLGVIGGEDFLKRKSLAFIKL